MQTMATSSNITIVKELEEVTSCPVCLDTCKDPRALPCMHVLCNQCIHSMVDTAKSGNKTNIRCPLCSYEAPIPTPPEQFPVSALINSLADILYKTRSTGTTYCQPCSEEEEEVTATWICIQCVNLLCKRCKKYHDRYEKSHLCIEVDNLKAQNVKAVLLKKRPHYCSKHDNKLDYLCVDCGVLLCVTCKLTGEKHKDHRTLYTKDEDVVQGHKRNVYEFNMKCEVLLKQYQECLDEVRIKEDSKDSEVDECINNIEKRYQEVHKALKRHKDELIKQAEAVRKQFQATANLKFMKLRNEIDQVKTTLQNTKRIEQEGTSIEVVTCSIQQLQQCEQMLATRPTSFMHNITLQDNFTRDAREVGGVFGDIKSTSVCSLEGNKFREFILGLFFRPTGLDIADGNITVAECHTNNIQTYDEEGSVVSSLEDVGPLNRAWNMVRHEEHTYVSDCRTGHVYVYGPDGNYCRTIEVGAKNYPGFTIWKDNLYITSYHENCVHVISLSDPSKRSIFAEHPEMRGPWSINTDGQMVVVSCRDSNSILVYDLEGQLKYIHGGLPKGNKEGQLNSPHGVLIDSHHHVIVADANNKRLVLVSDAGQVCGFTPLDAHPEALAQDSTGNIIVTTGNPNKVVYISYT